LILPFRGGFLPQFLSQLPVLLAAVFIVALGFPSTAAAQEKNVSLRFTKELLYNMARDNEGEMLREIVDRLRGLSPDVADVRLLRSGGHITLEYTVMAAKDVPVHFHLTLEKMALYRMAAARADIDGMLEILRPAVAKEPLILDLSYRFNDRYSIIDLSIDLRPVLEAREEEEMRKAAAAFRPPPTPRPEPEPKKEEAPPPEPEAKKEEKKPPPPKPKPKPVEKKPPPRLLVKKLGKNAAPKLDGSADDKAWGKAEPFSFPVRGASGNVTVRMSAVRNDDRVFFLVQWADKSEDKEHHPWVWSEEEGSYSIGEQVEDALALQFSAKKLGDCMLSGQGFVTDLWFWRAARTDPVASAEDGSLVVSTERLPKASFYEAKNKRTVWVKEQRDEGTAPYRSQVAGTFEGDKVHRYVPREPSGSVADVDAKGAWKNGQWTVELARSLDTGDKIDVAFKSGGEYYFSAAIFNARERSEHSTSKELPLNLE
jgi:hypothetical protein